MKSSLPNIPHEIIYYDILTRLPVKSLLRFKSVCKDWYALINSSTFIDTHQKYVLESHDSSDFMIVSNSCFYTYYDAPQFTSGTYVVLKEMDKHYFNVVVGSCNGLICLNILRFGLMLCNPITREYYRLIHPVSHHTYGQHDIPDYYGQYGFGYDIVTNHYKIVKIITSSHMDYSSKSLIVQVFSTYTNSWKQANNFPESTCISPLKYGVPINNTLHWAAKKLGDNTRSSLTFDLHTEEFGKMTLLELMTAGGRLYTVSSNRPFSNLTLWVMKEYGAPESWTKLVEIVDGQITACRISVITCRSRKEGEEILLKYFVDKETYELGWYNIKNKSIEKVDVTGKHKKDCVCIASLAPIPVNHQANVLL
ncbi:hypothetical protein RND81_12G146100 [Saponaria officinalis]|uniref:F-box domain-containing protein n=1 Tax=Saponaria officinalis TaxID=3572 RepID=A0AAW1HAQ1_SAPOF